MIQPYIITDCLNHPPLPHISVTLGLVMHNIPV